MLFVLGRPFADSFGDPGWPYWHEFDGKPFIRCCTCGNSELGLQLTLSSQLPQRSCLQPASYRFAVWGVERTAQRCKSNTLSDLKWLKLGALLTTWLPVRPRGTWWSFRLQKKAQ